MRDFVPARAHMRERASLINQSYLKTAFIVGKKYKFYGKVSKKSGRIEMNSPVFDDEHTNKNTGKIIPLYPLTYNLSQNVIRQVMENALKEVNEDLLETLPEYLLKEYSLYHLAYIPLIYILA